MIDLLQQIETTWTPANKQRYIDAGYVFTKYKDKIIVKAGDLAPQSDVPVKVVCDYCNTEQYIPYSRYINSTKNHTEKYCCKKCKGQKAHEKNYDPQKYYNKFVDSCIQKGYTPISDIGDYNGANSSKLKIWCDMHGQQETTYLAATKGLVCPQCAAMARVEWNKYSKEQVIDIIESKNNDIVLNPEEYINVGIPNLRIICGSCKDVFTTSLTSIKAGMGMCKKCASRYNGENSRLPIYEVISRIEASGDNKLLNPDEYISNSTINLKIQCGCGDTFTTSLNNFQKGKNKCDICGNSKSRGEYLIEEILKSLNISFLPEFSFSDCRDKNALPFDFYLPDFNACIEFDGQGHFESVFGEESFELTKRHDAIKNIYCEKSGIKLIRIPFWEAGNAQAMISNALHLTEHPIIIRYHKNPYIQ